MMTIAESRMPMGAPDLRLASAFIPIAPAHRDDGWPAASLAEHTALGKFDRGVSLLAWAYNEEALIESFLQRAIALLDRAVTDWEIVLVDDCSTDRTNEIATAFAAREPRLRLVRHERNLNVGFACRTAIANARKEFLFWQTVDWSYDISKLRIFLELLKHFDVVQGIRPVPIRLLSYIPVLRSIYRVRRRSDSFYKAIVSLGNYYVLTTLFGVRFHDFQNVTFYRTAAVQALPLVGRTSFINPELLLKSYYNGARIIEVPIRFISRQQGIAKGTRLPAVIRSVLDTVRNWIAWGIASRLRSVRGRPIRRVSEPFRLEQSTLRLVLPLFEDFKR
jgi:glycosyltransferase involved in cell wall biosynthesis